MSVLLAWVVGVSFGEASALAGTCTWKNPAVNSSWSNSSNWNASGGASCPPTSTSHSVSFSAGSSPCTIDAAATMSTFSISGYTGTITQSSAVSVNGAFTMSSGTFNQGAPLTVGGAFTQSGGTFVGSGSPLKIDVNGALNLQGGSFTSTDGRLELGGAFNKTGGTFSANNGQFVLNPASGTTTPNFGGVTFYDLIVNDGLAAYWKLDEASGTTAADGSGYSNTGTLQNSPAWATSSLPSLNNSDPAAITLNGTNQYLDVASPVTASNAAFTACAWVKFSSLSGAHTVISETGTNSSAFIVKRDSGGKFAFLMTGSDVNTPTNYQTIGTTTVATGAWYHVCGVYNGSTGTLYVNGSAEGTPATVSASWAAAGHTYVGAVKWNGATTDYVPGTIDDVRIYSRALAATDISRLAAGNQPIGANAIQSLGSALNVAHDLVIASGTLAAGSNAIGVGGSWWNYGGLFSGSGTVTFNGTGASNVIRSNGQSFGGINVSGSGTWTLGDALSMSTKTITVSAGTLTGLSYAIVAGTITESGSGNFIPGTGAVTLDGSTDAILPSGTYGALTINTSDAGLVGYWKLDEGTGTSFADSSGSGNSGTLVSAPTWSTSVPSSMRFSDTRSLSVAGGSDHGQVTVSSLSLNPSSGVTMAAWIYYAAVPTDASHDTVVLSGGSLLQMGFLKSAATGCSGGGCFAVWNSGAGGTPRVYTTTPPTSGWHHVAYTWDGTNSKLYIDGSAVDTRTNAPTSFTVATVYLSTYDGTSEPFTGKIDDVRLYNAALTATQIQRLGNGYATGSAPPTYTLGGDTTVSGAFSLTSGAITVGSNALTASSGLTVGGNGTLTMAASNATLSVGSGQSLIMNGTLNASNTGATIKSVSGSYAFQVGSTSTSTPFLNITGLKVKNTDANGMNINAVAGSSTTFTRFDNIAFSNGSNTSTGVLLQIYAAGLVLTSNGCSFDSGIGATTKYTVKLTGNGYTGTPDTTQTRALFGGATCSASYASCQASKSDDDPNNDGSPTTPASNGAVVQFVRAAMADTAGTVVGLPVTAFDWNDYSYYSTYFAYNSASGTSSSIYVRNGSGAAQYAWTSPGSDTIVGTPRFTTAGTKHYVYVATSSGKVYQLLDTGSALTTVGAAWTTNPYDCACTIVTPLGMDASNLYWGGTKSGNKLFTIALSDASVPMGSPFPLTPTVTSAAPAIWVNGATTYAFVGTVGHIIEINVSAATLAADNSNPGSASVWGRVALGTKSANRILAGDDAGNFWSIDPTPASFAGTQKVWRYTVASDAIKSSPYYHYSTNTVHFGTEGGKVVAVDSTGAALAGYPYQVATTSDPIRAAVFYWSGVLVVGTQTGKLFFIDRSNGSGPVLLSQYFFGPSEVISGIGYDSNVNRYMVSVADPSVKDGRIYYFDLVPSLTQDPTPSFQ